jgi:hypothetical protein
VDYRSRLHKEDDWLLSRTGMREVASDFNLIHGYASQTKDLDAQLEVYGSLFLTQAQSAEFKSTSEEERKVYLESHAADKLEVLWYFVVSLCRLLQTTRPDVTELYYRGIHDFDSLKGADLVGFSTLMNQLFRTVEEMYYLQAAGHPSGKRCVAWVGSGPSRLQCISRSSGLVAFTLALVQ